MFERDAIIASFEAQSELAPFSYREMLRNGKTKMFHRVAIGFFMQSAQQLSGINLVSTYANKILQESFGLAASTSHLIAAMGGLEYAVCSLLSVFLIEGLGRRRAFLWTTVGMSSCFAVIAGLQSTDSRTCQTDRCWIPVSLQYLLWPGLGGRTLSVQRRDCAAAMPRPGQRLCQRWQLVVLLCGGHDHPPCFPEHRLEDGTTTSRSSLAVI